VYIVYSPPKKRTNLPGCTCHLDTGCVNVLLLLVVVPWLSEWREVDLQPSQYLLNSDNNKVVMNKRLFIYGLNLVCYCFENLPCGEFKFSPLLKIAKLVLVG
jgi:hypothetical protein